MIKAELADSHISRHSHIYADFVNYQTIRIPFSSAPFNFSIAMKGLLVGPMSFDRTIFVSADYRRVLHRRRGRKVIVSGERGRFLLLWDV